MSADMPIGDPMPCGWCGQYHTTPSCFRPANWAPIAAAAPPVFGSTLTIENGEARCGSGCASLPCAHWPHYRAFTQPALSDSDIDRIAHRVVELLEGK